MLTLLHEVSTIDPRYTLTTLLFGKTLLLRPGTINLREVCTDTGYISETIFQTTSLVQSGVDSFRRRFGANHAV